MNQLVFLDTEFTDFRNPKLISIGLAATTGEEFYAEVPYDRKECSDFVREIVIPQLGQVPQRPYEELHLDLRSWFSVVKQTSRITICYDSDYDRRLFFKIFDDYPPSYIDFRNIGERHINELLRYGFHKENKLPEHHALNDALANRYAFREI